MNAARPFVGTRLPAFIAKSVLALKPIKTQAEIATQAGFTSANVMSMLKAGSIRLPLDRVQPLAIALEVDPAYLMLLRLEHMVGQRRLANRLRPAIWATTSIRHEGGR